MVFGFFTLLTSNSRTSISSASAIFERVDKSGCEVLVHHLETVTGSLPTFSASQIFVLPASANAPLILFNFFHCCELTLDANLINYFGIKERCRENLLYFMLFDTGGAWLSRFCFISLPKTYHNYYAKLFVCHTCPKLKSFLSCSNTTHTCISPLSQAGADMPQGIASWDQRQYPDTHYSWKSRGLPVRNHYLLILCVQNRKNYECGYKKP